VKKTRDQGNSISGLNITPIIDVALVLVIVMLVAAPVMNIPNMDLNLPDAYTSESKEQNISVSMDVNGRLAVDEKMVTPESLPAVLNAKLKKRPKTLVIVRADKDVEYAVVENLMDLLKTRTKTKRVAVATKQKVTVPGR
jgi:biopolymer transport protein ExbD